MVSQQYVSRQGQIQICLFVFVFGFIYVIRAGGGGGAPCLANRFTAITPLPAQISASNFHDLTQITQRRVCFNQSAQKNSMRTVFLCALG